MSRRSGLQNPLPRLPLEKAEEVLAELERVLENPLFRASHRCQSLLRRIVERSVVGDFESLRERVLGVQVFARAPDYDTSQDPVVRASAGEIRKKLAQYYQESGHESEIRIDLPHGSYFAEFHFHPDPPAPWTHAARSQWRKWRIVLVAVPAGVITLLAGLALVGTHRSDLYDLWGPVLKTPGSVLVCVGLQAAYNVRSAQVQDEIQGIVRPPQGTPRPPIREEDLVLLRDRYVALDDALCLVRLTSLLERQRKPYRVRAQRATSFADLRDTPAVLIGAFDNPWTLRTGDQLRFTFLKDSQQDTGMVFDRQHPENTAWKLVNYWPYWDVPVDYAIVTRMLDTTTDRPVIIAAGLTQYGTIGAGEFLTNETFFAEVANRLPKGWRQKNLQIVLSVPVVNRISGRPRVLATHVW